MYKCNLDKTYGKLPQDIDLESLLTLPRQYICIPDRKERHASRVIMDAIPELGSRKSSFNFGLSGTVSLRLDWRMCERLSRASVHPGLSWSPRTISGDEARRAIVTVSPPRVIFLIVVFVTITSTCGVSHLANLG